MATIFDLERDPTELLKPYRLRHKNPTFNDGFPGAQFRDGLTVDPVEPQALKRLLVAMGDDLELVPVESEPAKPAPPAQVAQPAVEAGPEADADDGADQADGRQLPDNVEALRALATSLGIETDGRWGKRKLRRAILNHQKAA
jgi:hypothetical protein